MPASLHDLAALGHDFHDTEAPSSATKRANQTPYLYMGPTV